MSNPNQVSKALNSAMNHKKDEPMQLDSDAYNENYEEGQVIKVDEEGTGVNADDIPVVNYYNVPQEVKDQIRMEALRDVKTPTPVHINNSSSNTITFNLGKIGLIILVMTVFALGFGGGMLYSTYQDIEEKMELIEDYTSSLEIYETNDVKKTNIISQYSSDIVLLKSENADKASVIENLENAVKERDDIISLFLQREELFNKYEHALYTDSWNGSSTRTDITYDQLVFGVNEMTERGLDPNLMFGVYSLESNYDEDAKNNKSTARGYGQFLKGTGKWVYETLLEYEDYDHEMALDGYVNMEMTAEYLGYLMDMFNGDIEAVLISYNGNELGPLYYNIINNYLNREVGYGLYTIEANYQKGAVNG